MNIKSMIQRSLIVVVLCLFSGNLLHANPYNILILSPSVTFPASGIASELQALLQASGATATVGSRDIYKAGGLSESLFGAAYVPPYRVDHVTAIQQGGWTHVVMIDSPLYYASAVELHYVGVNAMSKIISAAGAQPVLMMPWVDRSTLTNAGAVNNAQVREYAYRVGDGVRDSLGQAVPVVPAGVAWSTLDTTNRGTVPTQPANGVALNTNAKYSAASSLFTHLTGQNAKTAGYLPSGLTSLVRDAIADHVFMVAGSEAVAARYTGEFTSTRVKFWPAPATIKYSAEGTSTENSIRDQLLKMGLEDGCPMQNTRDIFVKTHPVSPNQSNLVFGRWNFSLPTSGYDDRNQVTTMVATFDRQYDDITNGAGGAVYAEYESQSNYIRCGTNSWTYLPYHLLWVRTMYDLNIPIDTFSVHAPDWQFAASASALYTMRTGGRNGVYPATTGDVLWSPALRAHRFSWQTAQMAWQTMHEMATLKPAPAVPDRPYGLDRIIDAEYFASTSRALAVGPNAVETFQINGIGDGDWMSYKVDFGTTAPSVLGAQVNLATVASGGQLEVRDGSATGTLLGTLDIPATGGANTFQTARGFLLPLGLSGIRELFFVFRLPGGGQIAFDHFQLVLLARSGESIWVSPAGGAWDNGTHWQPEVPEGSGKLARFSLDIPGGLAAGAPVTIQGVRTIGNLELGHGTGTTGGVWLQAQGGSARLNFQTAAAAATINKLAGGDDTLSVPIESGVALQINNKSTAAVRIQGGISGQNDLYPCGTVAFESGTYDLGRVGYGRASAEPFNMGANVTWSGSGTVRNFYLRLASSWTINAGSLTNLGWTDLGNDEVGGNGTSTLTLNEGSFSHASTQYFRLGQRSTVSTLVNLNGGIFETQAPFTKGAGATTFTFNGGLFRFTGSTDTADLFASGANPDVVTKVGTGGMRFEVVSGRSVTLQNDLSPVGSVDGGLRKTGAGTLVLSGSQILTGPVVVEQGVLRATGVSSLGYPNRFTVSTGATLSVPGPGGIGVYGAGAGWTGAGTLEGGIYVAAAPVDLSQGPLTVTDYATFGDLQITFVPQPGTTVIQVGGELALYGALALDVQAPAQAIPAGGTVTLASGATRDGEFSSVSGSNLWAVSYSGASVVLTAQANIPGVVLAAPNNGAPATWGEDLVLSASASDVVGISKVEFYANGHLIGQGVEGPAGVYTFSWNLGEDEAQTYIITTRVTNQDGVALESPGQNLVVSGLAGSSATWTNPAGGTWSNSGNWLAGNVADSYGTAYFDTLDLPTGTATVEVDSPRTLAKLQFSDLGSGTVGTWKLIGSGSNKIQLSGGAAEVAVDTGSSAELAVPLAASAGFTKSGGGSLALTVANSGLAGATKITSGTLSVTDSGALGNSTLTLRGGGLLLPSAVTLGNPLSFDSGVLTTLTHSAPVTCTGGWTDTNAAVETTLRLWSTSALATTSLANTIHMPGTDLEVAGLSNTVNFSGNVYVRNFKFYGRTGTPQGDLNVIFSGNAVASCAQSLTTVNDGRITNIRINDQASLTLPGYSTSGRSNFYLNGGVLTARRFPVGAFSAVFANGGVLRPMASDPQFMYGINNSVRPFQVQAGGLKVDTNGFDVGMVASIVANTNPDGGVTKMGAGVMTVDGSSINMTWRGPTRVLGGTWRLGSASGLSVNSTVFEISGGAALDIASSTTPTLSLTGSGHVLSGSGRVIGALSISAGTVNLTAGQPLQVTGNVGLGGGILSVGGSLTGPGDFALLTANQVAGTFSSVGTLPVAPVGFTRQLVYESNRVLVRVSGPGETWLAANAAPGARFSDDADGNGWTLLQEYALGALPGANTGGRLSAGLSADGKPRMNLAYNTAAIDTTIEVQISHDLTTWTTLLSRPAGSTTSWTQHVAGASIEGGSESGGVQQVVVTAPATAETKAFFRVRVLRAE